MGAKRARRLFSHFSFMAGQWAEKGKYSDHIRILFVYRYTRLYGLRLGSWIKRRAVWR